MRSSLLALLVVLGAGCLKDPRRGEGAGYVVGDGASSAETVRVAWVYVHEDYVEHATLRGQAAVEEGAFDVDVLLADQEGFSPPPRGCPDLGYVGPDAVEPDQGTIAVGRLVATAADLGETNDLPLEDLPSLAVAAALEVAVIWSSDEVARDSVNGQRLESQLHAGFQLARLRPCRVPVECQGIEDVLGPGSRQDLCLDPWPSDGILLLEAWDGRF